VTQHCIYCQASLSLARRLRGEPFCSSEHGELHHQAQSRKAFERVLDLAGPTATSSAAPDDKGTAPSLLRLWIFAVAGALTILALGTWFFGPAYRKNQSAAAAPPVSQAPAAVTTIQLPPGHAAKVLPSRNTAAAAESRASIQANAASWVVACADGKLLFAKLFQPGGQATIDFDRAAIVRAGRPGAVQIEVNGQRTHTPLPASGVSVIDLNRQGAHLRPGGEPDDCTAGH